MLTSILYLINCQIPELLELCESDNLGVRYLIIGLYTVLERFEECEKIYNPKFDSCKRVKD